MSGAPQLPDFGPLQGKATLLPQYSNLGQNRPFGPGEYLALPNGGWANEMSYTLPMNNQWSVIPGLWMMNGVPTRVSEDQALELAQQSGLTWRSFADQKAAEQFANQREALWQKAPYGGSHAQQPLWSRPWPPKQ